MTESKRSPGTVLFCAFLALAALSSAGCGGKPDRPNVLFIVVDTLRADRLGCLGSDRSLTPSIDAFAKEGALFRKAYSHAPWTLPAFASLLSSQYPIQHKAGYFLGKGRFSMAHDGYRTVGHCFGEAGYATAAFVNVLFLSESFGMERGFDELDYVANNGNRLSRTANHTTDAALAWLGKEREKPFLLMVHYFDPHLLFDPPASFRRRHAMPGDRETADPIFGSASEIVAFRDGRVDLDVPTVRRLEGLYDAEVAFTDSEVGRLLAGLEELGLDEETIVVFTADHGEEFLDHGGFEHGHTLFDELIHVPLAIRWPGVVPAGVVVDATVRHVDVAPTVCGLAGVIPGEHFFGDDLAPLWEEGTTPRDRWVYAEGNHWGQSLLSLRAGQYKTIADPESKRVEIYDMASDPGETEDLSRSGTVPVQQLLDDVLLFRSKMGEIGGNARPADLTAEQEQRLRELGYSAGN